MVRRLLLSLSDPRLKELIAFWAPYGVRALDTGQAQGVAAEGATAKDVGLAIANTGKKKGEGTGDATEEGGEAPVFKSPFRVVAGHGAPNGVKQGQP